MATHPQLQAQALVLGAEVVDTAHQIHEWLQGLRVADQRSTAPYQDGQARAEGGVQPLDESGVELGQINRQDPISALQVVGSRLT
jgi:hypothetical protein